MMTKKTKKSSTKKTSTKKVSKKKESIIKVLNKNGFKYCSFELNGESYKIIGKDCYQRARKLIDNNSK